MSLKNVIAVVLNAHLPFARKDGADFSFEEIPFYSMVSETLLPLLEMFDRLESDKVPFRMGLAVSPVLCHLLTDETLVNNYLDYVDRQIAFGTEELERVKNDPAMRALAEYYFDNAIERRIAFTERYEKNIPRALARYQKKGRLELLTSPATNCFLPFYVNHYEVIRAQIETALASHKKFFNVKPAGLLLPELGYSNKLSAYMRYYGFRYTILDTLSALLADPPPRYGSFFPLKTKNDLILLVKDFYAHHDITDREQGLPVEGVFRDFFHDAADDLPLKNIKRFLAADGTRLSTGYKYYSIGDNENAARLYDPAIAAEKANSYAELFLERRVSALNRAVGLMRECPPPDTRGKADASAAVSLVVLNADSLGRFWHEGTLFLENVFRAGCAKDEIQFMTPSEYIDSENEDVFQVIKPEFSSSGFNGYAESLLDASNDGFYRHIFYAAERMAELAERFRNETGIKERALNQAAREILLALSSDWQRLMSTRNSVSLSKWRHYARSAVESHLKNFTTIYEALGSDYLSTRFLTDIEHRNNIFPDINYGVFRRK
jgi:1,4-alpha-glucan branching enzyme